MGSEQRRGRAASYSQGIQRRLFDPRGESDDRHASHRTARGGDLRRDESSAGVLVRAAAGGAGFMPADRGKAAAGEGISGTRAAGAGGTDGGEHFTQSEKSAGFDEDHLAGAIGESGAARFDTRRNEDGAG